MSMLITMQSILHVCGGDPNRTKIKSISDVYSPRMWGDPEEIMNVIIREHKEKF